MHEPRQGPQQGPLQQPDWHLVGRVARAANASITPLGYAFGLCVVYNLSIAPASHLPALPLWVFGVLIVLGVLAPGATVVAAAALVALRQRTPPRSHRAPPEAPQRPE